MKKQKNHENALIEDGPHMPEIGTHRTCLCHTTGKGIIMVSSLHCGSEVTFRLVTSGVQPGIQD